MVHSKRQNGSRLAVLHRANLGLGWAGVHKFGRYRFVGAVLPRVMCFEACANEMALVLRHLTLLSKMSIIQLHCDYHDDHHAQVHDARAWALGEHETCDR